MKIYVRAASSIRVPWRYVVYSYDIDADEEIESVKGFSGAKLDDAIKYAKKYASEHADEGEGAHVVIIPNDEDDEDAVERMFEETGLEPFEVAWASYK